MRRGPRNPGVVYAGIALALVAVLAAVALTARQPPPPTIAEFAPQAIEQIRNAPSEQQSSFGAPGGEGGAGSPARVEQRRTVFTRTIDVARVRRCVGDPPRQIEDPQSPPCVPFWSGDNGGSTWTGVTRDEIRIVIPTDENSSGKRLFQLLEKFFNKRFEFYGRRMRFFYGRSGGGSSDYVEQRAEATDDYQRYKPFVASRYKSGIGTAYSNEIARRGAVTVTQAFLNITNRLMWQYITSADEMFTSTGNWVCNRLVGRAASHAGSPSPGQIRRVFGVVMMSGYQEDKTTADVLIDKIRRCGGTVAATSTNEFNGAGDEPKARTVMLRMKEAGVTSVFCFCHLFFFGPFQVAASQELYYPEWLVNSFGYEDLNAFIKLGGNPPEQMQHTFGLTFQPRQLTLPNEPFLWAAQDVDPTYGTQDQSAVVEAAEGIYRPLLLIASGIQMAGPHLTPRTFEEGLERTVFPNPDHPNKPGKVGFGSGTHSMTLDGAEIWWSNSALGPNKADSPGTYCYVDAGRRHTAADWPRGGDPFFKGPCL